MEVDSEVVVRLLGAECPSSSPYIHIIRKCKALMARPEWDVTMAHCYREANRVADWLANFGVRSEQKLVILSAIPKDLRAILLEDQSGVS